MAEERLYSPPQPEPPSSDANEFEGWISGEHFVRGRIESTRPWGATGHVSLRYFLEIAGQFLRPLVSWKYEEFAGRALFRVTYTDEHGAHEWTHQDLAADPEEDAADVWENIFDAVEKWHDDWRWHARAEGRDRQLRSARGEAAQRGISVDQLIRLCRRYGVATGDMNGEPTVDALGVDRALGQLIDATK